MEMHITNLNLLDIFYESVKMFDKWNYFTLEDREESLVQES